MSATLPGRDEVVDKVVIGWMESIGPTTADELAARLHLAVQDIESSLLRLEGQGLVLRGRFRPTQHSALNTQHSGAAPVEWCHRRLLARIHRLTIGKLRKEIEPVSAAEFMRFLFQWQHVAPGSRLHGKDGLLEVIRQLSGFEAAASAWEPHLLRSRLSKYDPALLDQACLSGAVAWGRLSPHPRSWQDPSASRGRRVVPTSVAPISIFPREEGGWLLTASGDESSQDDPSDGCPRPRRRCIAISGRGARVFSRISCEARHCCRLKLRTDCGNWWQPDSSPPMDLITCAH